MLEVMMALGGYRFSLSTSAYAQLSRHATWRWPMQERLGAHPVSQYVGPGEQTITLEGTVYPHYKGLLALPSLIARIPPLAAGLGHLARIRAILARFGLGGGASGEWQLERLRQEAEAGVPLLLVDGRGRVWGYWAVTELQETETRHMADGQALAVDFQATLTYYGEDAPQGQGGDTSLGGALRDLLGL